MQTQVQFHWKVAYGGEVEYEVLGDGPMYRVTLRFEADDYFRSIYNGGADQWGREVVASIGVLHTYCSEMVKPHVLAAFNAYLPTSCHANVGEVVTGYFNHDPRVRTWVRLGATDYAYNGQASRQSFDRHYHCYMNANHGWCCEPRAEVA